MNFRRPRLSRNLGALAVALSLLPLACVQHPTPGVSDQTETNSPWEEGLLISGVTAEPSQQVLFQVATNPEATEFDFLATSTSSGTAIQDPALPDSYPFARPSTTIPQQYWIPGISAGYRVRLRAVIGGVEDDTTTFDYVLGTAESFNTPEVCALLQQNDEFFGTSAPTIAAACLNPPSPFELTFTFQTPDFNDHCGLVNEACCTVGEPCDPTANLTCEPQGDDSMGMRCRAPDVPVPDGESDAGSGGISDDEACEDGDIEVMEFAPSECQDGFGGEEFKVTGFRKCVGGKFREPTAAQCNTGNEIPEGTQCYCTIQGGDCGIGVGSPCNFTGQPEDASDCVPGAMCAPVPMGGVSQWQCLEFDPNATDRCWTADDTVPFMIDGDPMYPEEECTTGDEDCDCFPNSTCTGALFCVDSKCSATCETGTDGCECFANDTCNSGLTCTNSVCVEEASP